MFWLQMESQQEDGPEDHSGSALDAGQVREKYSDSLEMNAAPLLKILS